MSGLPYVSILVLNYNGKNHLDEFLRSVLSLNYPKNQYEVVMIDNGSTDGSAEYVERKYPWVKLIRLDKNYGFASGNNIGARYCRGEFLALINNDTVLDRNWLIELVKHASRNPNAVYGSVMLKYGTKDLIIYYGGKLTAWGFARHLKTWMRYAGVRDKKPILTFYADGCGLLISKDLFFKLKGFDDTYFCVAEDYELSWKAWLMGYKVYLVPTAKFWHKVSATMGAMSRLHMYLLWRNQLRNIIKFAEGYNMVHMLVLSTIYTILTIISLFCLLEKKPYLALSVIRAYADVLRELPKLMRKRVIFQHTRRIKDDDLRRSGLIMNFLESIKEETKAWLRRRHHRRYA